MLCNFCCLVENYLLHADKFNVKVTTSRRCGRKTAEEFCPTAIYSTLNEDIQRAKTNKDIQWDKQTSDLKSG